MLHYVEYRNLSGESTHFVSLNIPFLVKGTKESQFYKVYTVIVVNEPHIDQLYLQESTWFLFTSVYFVTLFDLPQNTNNDKRRQLHKSK